MTEVLSRQLMPEEVNPDLDLVYDALKQREDWDTMDVLDAIVIGDRPVTKEAIMQHCCGGLNQRTALEVVGRRIKQLNAVMREHGMRVRGNSTGQHPSKITYRICDMCVAGVVAISMIMWGGEAAAQTCKPREEIVKALKGQYQEARRAYGLSKQNHVLELFASASGTWTAIMSQPGGVSCIVAVGDAWTEMPMPKPGEPL